MILYSHQVFACVSFAYPCMDKNKKEKIPWLKSKKKTGFKKKKRFSMKDGEKVLPKPIKALGSTSLHLTSSASKGARRLKLEGLSKKRFPKTKRLQMIRYHGWTVVDQ